ncbi:pilus assembly PilX N-terminal domain-containing protein [Lysinibacillus piscis]|uniref:Type 4 fimbrial biogenesis protein PilX N-terminal domain-containing protein n=1 Tax=Lysinibacillus piscis TaxID=2518931 RepID=A0ABQ5NG70_9BACI|nr:pilus assembly PilX N-terminal domain-containing protein [Lysinibacillus sp. KH24]GLC87269.1 hypothetical protein LYSBPC_03960 [Lysinibacillus sp. KH24]
MIQRLNNQRGSALVMALFLIVVISILGVSLLSVSSNSLKQVDYERTDQAVFYIAEAGMSLAKLEVKEQLEVIQKSSYQQITNWIAEQNSQRKANNKPRLTKEEAEAKYRTILNSEFTAFNNASIVSNSHAISAGKVATIAVDSILPLDNEPLVYKIILTSEGTINSAKEREVTQEIQIEPRLSFGDDSDNGNGGNNEETPSGFPEGYTAIVSGNIAVSGGGTITGHASLQKGTVTLSGGAKITGNISLSDASNVHADHWIDYTTVPKLNIDPTSYLSPTFFPDDKFSSVTAVNQLPNKKVTDGHNTLNIIDNGDFNATNWLAKNYTLDLTSTATDVKFKNFKVYENNTININIGDREINLFIDKLDLPQAHIKIIGSGKLNLYVQNSITLKGSLNSGGKPEQVNVFYQGTSPLQFNNETQIYGSIINNSAAMTLTGGAGLYGNIVSGGNTLNISGGVPTNGQFIIAPNAKLNLKEGGKITGIVVAKDIIADGGTSIVYGGPATPLPPGVGPDNDFPAPEKEDNFWIDETSMVEK